MVLIFLFFSDNSYAQETIVSGKVIDAETGDPVPFANVFFTGTTIGTTTDFDGFFKLSANEPGDSLSASYVGYLRKTKRVERGKNQIVNFQLQNDVVSLQEVIIIAGENPAYTIIRNIVKNKEKNDQRSLSAYEYESYNKIEIDIDQMSEKLRQKKVMRKISAVLDSIDQIAGEDGKPILPVFISESMSMYYFRTDPRLKREYIKHTKITGLGVQDGSVVAQFIGSSFQEYNFYENWLTIAEKEFVSPIADGWKIYYDYELMDSLFINGHYCYKIDVYPRRPQDLAFKGTIWVTKKEFALKQVDLMVDESANLNFIEKIKIQQELEPTAAGPWLPVKTRKLFDIGELQENAAGLLLKVYTSTKDWKVNQPRDNRFYERPIEVAEDARTQEESYWVNNRHDSLTGTEKNVYAMIDTLKKIPVVKSYVEVINILFNGYKKVGKVDLGPYFLVYANNNVEGHRLRAGFRTNIHFSDQWVFKGFLAYGTRDEEFKYSAAVNYIFSRKRWTIGGLEYKKDIEQVGLFAEELEDNSAFYAVSWFGNLERPYTGTSYKAWFQTEVRKGLRHRIEVNNQYFEPLFDFAYKLRPSEADLELGNKFTTTAVSYTVKYARDELFLQNDNERISLGPDKWPVFAANYTYGIKDILGGDFEFHKASVNVTQNINMGFLGRSLYSLTAGKIFSTLPYPLLKTHIGNETVFSTTVGYNLMNRFEFVSDQYISLNYQHFFEGFILNRVPLLRKLKWRLVATGNILYGSLSEKNRNIIPERDFNGNEIPRFGSLSPHKPYVELGYGIENIFKIIRIDAYHRITYTNNPDASNFGVKINFQLIL